MMIKNVIFDMGGVIVDVCRERAVRNFQAIGVDDADQLIDAYHHKGIFWSIENGDIDVEEFCRLLRLHTGKNILRASVETAWRSMIDPPPAYKLEYLRELRKTHRTYLLTNNNPIIMDWACSQGFTPFGDALSDYFDKLYISYQMKCMKPSPQIYRAMLEDAGMNPAESLFIDDSKANADAAQSCGMQVYLAQNGADWREDLSRIIG